MRSEADGHDLACFGTVNSTIQVCGLLYIK